jgi:hypothetical protein
LSFNSVAQSEDYDVVVYKDWMHSGSGYFTIYDTYYVYNDFDWAITRSVEKFNGYYIFDIWFFSQSYIKTGEKIEYISTNIRDIYVYANKVQVSRCVNPVGITFFDAESAYTLRFYHKNAYPGIFMKWGNMAGL